MKHECALLLRLEARDLFGWNRFRHTSDKRERRRWILLAVVWAFLGVLLVGYVAALSYGLIAIGLATAVLPYLALIASMFVFLFGVFKTKDTLFARRGYELLASLPIRQRALVRARFLLMYLQDAALTALVVLPGFVVYAILTQPPIRTYGLVPLGILLLPALPLSLSVAVGVLVAAVTSRIRRRGVAEALLSIAFVVLVLVGSTMLGSYGEAITVDAIAQLAEAVQDLIGTVYPPAMWFALGATTAPLYFLALAGVSFAAILVTFAVVSLTYERICRRLFVSAKMTQKDEKTQQRGLYRTLLRREWKRYFSSGVYVTNTIIGPIMGLLLSVAVLAVGVDGLTAELALPINIPSLLPFVVAAVFCMMPITAVSVSMEGQGIRILQALPLSTRAWLDGKILLQLVITAPFYLVSEILLLIALGPDWLEAIRLLLIPAALILFSTVAALSINLAWHRFDWEKEVTVVKQSTAAGLGGFCGTLASILCALVSLAIPEDWSLLFSLALLAILTLVTYLLYRRNAMVRMETL